MAILIRIFLISIIFSLISCVKEHRNNNYLPKTNFSIRINTKLPLYNKLKTPLSPIEITHENAGLRGIVVINTGSGYRAWERACPNRPLSECSTMVVVDNIQMECPCDKIVYNLVNGSVLRGTSAHSLLSYKVEQSGDILIISNY